MYHQSSPLNLPDYTAALSISKGNSKIGANTPSFSLPAHSSCPGASDWCRKVCYAARITSRFPNARSAYERNMNLRHDSRFVNAMVDRILKAKRPEFRIHVSGDFDKWEYIQDWWTIVNRCCDVTFWAYTRSWTQPELRAWLEDLRELPNMQLFASIDTTIEQMPPEGWRVAYIDEDPRFRGMVCLEQVGKMKDCTACGYCQRKRRGNVQFITH